MDLENGDLFDFFLCLDLNNDDLDNDDLDDDLYIFFKAAEEPLYAIDFDPFFW